MTETSHPMLYKAPVAGKVIYEFDLLKCLSKHFGDNIVRDREPLYTLLSGKTKSNKEYCEVLAYCYRRYSAFANFIDFEYYFGDEGIKLFDRIINKLQNIVREERCNIASYGGKWLMENMGYVYIAFPIDKAPSADSLEGVINIYV